MYVSHTTDTHTGQVHTTVTLSVRNLRRLLEDAESQLYRDANRPAAMRYQYPAMLWHGAKMPAGHPRGDMPGALSVYIERDESHYDNHS